MSVPPTTVIAVTDISGGMLNAQSQAQQVIACLNGEIAYLEKITATAEQAADLVRRSEQQAIQVGYPRVADGLHQIERRVLQAHEAVHRALGSSKQAIESAGQVTSKTTPEDAAQMLEAVASEIDGIHKSLLGTHSQIRKIEDEVAAVLRGAKPGPTLDLLEGMRTSLRQAASEGTKAKEHCKITGESGGRIGSGGSGN
jgi:hypothetical protein